MTLQKFLVCVVLISCTTLLHMCSVFSLLDTQHLSRTKEVDARGPFLSLQCNLQLKHCSVRASVQRIFIQDSLRRLNLYMCWRGCVFLVFYTIRIKLTLVTMEFFLSLSARRSQEKVTASNFGQITVIWMDSQCPHSPIPSTSLPSDTFKTPANFIVIIVIASTKQWNFPNCNSCQCVGMERSRTVGADMGE